MSLHPGVPGIGPVELDGFEVWDRTVHAPAGQGEKAAFVSLRIGGVISLNKVAREMLGPCDAVKIMYDPKRRRLGFVVADPEAANSYEVSPFTSIQFSCCRLFSHYGIEITEARRYYDLRVIDGVLVVHLDGESEHSPKVPRQRTGRARF